MKTCVGPESTNRAWRIRRDRHSGVPESTRPGAATIVERSSIDKSVSQCRCQWSPLGQSEFNGATSRAGAHPYVTQLVSRRPTGAVRAARWPPMVLLDHEVIEAAVASKADRIGRMMSSALQV